MGSTSSIAQPLLWTPCFSPSFLSCTNQIIKRITFNYF
ncbi:hypothetical protein E2C01_002199 [Portunus trituberculatus]|uniref:Uncharacterized protein n=1 Tax=Portunus trituberculatus TaxID=210409 RepID=A0A5B7CLK4_PORTR|nr:hypothetical protein [Portunus trituberculatus]